MIVKKSTNLEPPRVLHSQLQRLTDKAVTVARRLREICGVLVANGHYLCGDDAG